MSVLAWWGLFAYLNSILSSYSFAIDKSRVVMVQTGLALALGVCFNLLLIPRYGAAGAAYSIVVAEGASFLFLMLQQAVARVHLGFGEVGLTLLRLGAVSLVAGLVGLFLCSVNVVLGLVTALALYVLLVLLTGDLGRRERDVLLALVGRQSG